MEEIKAITAWVLPIVAFVILLVIVWWILSLRRVVPTNEVHIVQAGGRTIPYGRSHPEDAEDAQAGAPIINHGNVYYEWPKWIPYFGIEVFKLPLSVFGVDIEEYEAYDQGRLPFILDIVAFFRIKSPNQAATRVSSTDELRSQLKAILQGSVRTILAKETIESIMENRAEFGARFTDEVDTQLLAWGVTTVKSIELMDIRDAKGSSVIANIMAMKKSEIERDSRVTVADNQRLATNAETVADREKDLIKLQAQQEVGQRQAEVERQVGISREQAQQSIQIEAKTTAERQADVKQVNEVRSAEIRKSVAVVQADQDKSVAITQAEAKKEVDIREAEAKKEVQILVSLGLLDAQRNEAQGIEAVGRAKGAADTAILMAPVETQIKLATEIGTNVGYQTYLIGVRNIEASEKIGVAQSEALKAAGIKVIVTGGTVQEGVSNIGELFTARGGTKIGAMLDGLANTETGKAVLDAVGVSSGGGGTTGETAKQTVRRVEHKRKE
jgi:flotillin